MTTRLKNLIQTVCIVLILMLFPSTARLQEQQAVPVPPQAAEPQGEAAVPPAEPVVAPPATTTEKSEVATPAPAADESATAIPAPSTEESATAAPAPTAEESAAASPAPAAENQSVYIIKQRDTLWDIANAYLKDPFLWPFIWKANTYITNPDLIYPGNKLVIPSLTPVEQALQSEAVPEEAVVQEPTTTPQEEGAAAAIPETPVQPAPAAAEEEIPAPKSRLILPEEQIYPIFDKYAMISAGFVNEEETRDTIIGGQEEGKSIFGYDDIVYVTIRDADSVNIGDKYLIFSSMHSVRHPITHKYLGNLIKGLGLLQIIAKDPAAKVFTARITLSFDAIEKGNMLAPYQEPVPIYHSQKKAKDISGYIIEVTDSRSINAQSDVVYLDKGNVDGVEAGDRFLVYEEPSKKDFPRKMVGEVQVILVKEHTSTAVVKKSTETMGKGNAVEFEK